MAAPAVDLSGAPAPLDDATFDSLFPTDGTSHVAAPAQPAAPATQGTAASTQNQTAPTQSNQSATTAQPGAPYLKAERSIYNTPEAAIEGINQKDALIEQLRTRYALTTGIDPVTGQPVGQAPAPKNEDYFDNPTKYLDDLYQAAKQGGPQAYRDVQAKFMLDTLKPLQPMLQRVAREQAVEEVAKDIKDVGPFIGTPAYQNALEVNPELKSAIAIAESDYRFHSRLPGLYKLAYLTGQGLQMPELVKAAANQQTTQTNQTQARPTLQPTTQAPPTKTTPPNLKTLEGIKAVLAEAEAKGLKLEF